MEISSYLYVKHWSRSQPGVPKSLFFGEGWHRKWVYLKVDDDNMNDKDTSQKSVDLKMFPSRSKFEQHLFHYTPKSNDIDLNMKIVTLSKVAFIRRIIMKSRTYSFLLGAINGDELMRLAADCEHILQEWIFGFHRVFFSELLDRNQDCFEVCVTKFPFEEYNMIDQYGSSLLLSIKSNTIEFNPICFDTMSQSNRNRPEFILDSEDISTASSHNDHLVGVVIWPLDVIKHVSILRENCLDCDKGNTVVFTNKLGIYHFYCLDPINLIRQVYGALTANLKIIGLPMSLQSRTRRHHSCIIRQFDNPRTSKKIQRHSVRTTVWYDDDHSNLGDNGADRSVTLPAIRYVGDKEKSLPKKTNQRCHRRSHSDFDFKSKPVYQFDPIIEHDNSINETDLTSSLKSYIDIQKETRSSYCEDSHTSYETLRFPISLYNHISVCDADGNQLESSRRIQKLLQESTIPGKSRHEPRKSIILKKDSTESLSCCSESSDISSEEILPSLSNERFTRDRDYSLDSAFSSASEKLTSPFSLTSDDSASANSSKTSSLKEKYPSKVHGEDNMYKLIEENQQADKLYPCVFTDTISDTNNMNNIQSSCEFSSILTDAFEKLATSDETQRNLTERPRNSLPIQIHHPTNCKCITTRRFSAEPVVRNASRSGNADGREQRHFQKKSLSSNLRHSSSGRLSNSKELPLKNLSSPELHHSSLRLSDNIGTTKYKIEKRKLKQRQSSP